MNHKARGEFAIRRVYWEQMRHHVTQTAPEEACGLVSGGVEGCQRIYLITNALHSSTRFRMDPHEQIRALVEIADKACDLVAIFHSHPQGPGIPSDLDIAEAAYPEAVYLVWAPKNGVWACRAFQIIDHQSKEIELRIID